jgi:hypothetical protein
MGHLENFKKVTNGDFTIRPDGELGAVDTAHGVFFGRYKGREVAVKAHANEGNATHEADMLKTIAAIGITAVNPYRVIPSRTEEAFLVTDRMNLASGASLPFSGQGRRSESAFASASDIARTLGKLHGNGITHGDAQIKNFGLHRETIDFTTNRPAVVVYDPEKGGTDAIGHGKSRPYDHDLASLPQSLAYKSLGGHNLDSAVDTLEQFVLTPYEEASTMTGLDTHVATSAVNHAFDKFVEVRDKLAFATSHGHGSSQAPPHPTKSH